MNLVDAILRHGRGRPGVAALADGGRELTYAELRDLVLRTAGHLASLGVRPGERVGICLKDGWRHVVVLLAAGALNAVAVPLDWRARGGEKTRVCEALGFKLVLIEPGDEFAAACPTVAADAAWWRAVDRAVAPDRPAPDANAPFVIAPTSGTTGLPKFSPATHLQYYFRIVDFPEFQALTRPCRYLSTTPLYFGAGQRNCLAHLVRGDTVMLHPSLFRASDLVETVNAAGIDIAFVVPTAVRKLLEIAGEAGPLLPGLSALVAGGAPLFAHEKQAAARRLTPHFYERYGSSAAGGISTLCPGDLAERGDSVGQVNPLVEVEIVDEGGRPVPPGTTGRLRVRGLAVGTPLTDSDEFRGGWYYPGEVAALDARDYLYIEGRASDVIMRGGAKIYPSEIEAALREHAGVADVAVIGTRAADNEETIVAFVTARGGLLDVGTLRAHCRGRLTPYKIPSVFHIVAELPRNTGGKVDRARLVASLDQKQHGQ